MNFYVCLMPRRYKNFPNSKLHSYSAVESFHERKKIKTVRVREVRDKKLGKIRPFLQE